MRIGFCLFEYFAFGGMQQDCLLVMEACLKRGYEVIVYTLAWHGEQPKGLTIRLLKKKGLSNHAKYLHFSNQLKECRQKDKLDLLVGFNKISGLDLYFAADPCYVERVRSKYGLWYTYLSQRFQQLAYFEQLIFSTTSSTEIVVLSEKEKAKFLTVYPDSRLRFTQLPPGIIKQDRDPHNLIRQHKRQELGANQTQKVVLFVGSGFKIKGLDRAIAAFQSLPEINGEPVVFWVVGDGPRQKYQQKLFERDERAAVRVLFLGGRKDVFDLMQAADCLLHPAYNETGGKVLLEAATLGLPVVTTDQCGYAPYIRNSCMGRVLPSPFRQQALDIALLQTLEAEPMVWQKRHQQFLANTDVFDLPEKFVDLIETKFSDRVVLANAATV